MPAVACYYKARKIWGQDGDVFLSVKDTEADHVLIAKLKTTPRLFTALRNEKH